MFDRLFLPFLLLTHLVGASNDLAPLRQQESALADAVKAKDRVALSLLTDRNFHVDWTSGSAFRNVRINMSREDWVNGLGRLRIASYKIEISSVNLTDSKATSPLSKQLTRPPLGSTVKLNEFWTLLLPGGRVIEKRVNTIDVWVKQDGVWKLAVRLCQSDAQTPFPQE